MLTDRRIGDRWVILPGFATPPVALEERRQSPRRALDRLQAELVQKLEVLDLMLAGVQQAAAFERVLTQIAAHLAQDFHVGKDEVAILLLKDQGQFLRFAYPLEFYRGKLNFFPVTLPSVAGRVVRTRLGTVHNDMATIPHLHIYERIRVADRPAQPIQKMVAAPLIHLNGDPVGVIEVCRKAATLREAGPDFTELDLLKLTDFVRILATYVVRFMPDDF